MDMVSKVKAAIRDAAVPHQGGTIACAPAFRSLSYYASVGIDYFSHDPSRLEALFDIAARAALEAMRDYTPAMSEAGYEAAANHAATTGRAAYQGDIEVGYLAYIDQALSDQPRPTEEKA